MNWERVNIVSVASITNESVEEFLGEKIYIATGDLKETLNDDVSEKVTFDNRPSRANLTAKKGDVILARMKGTDKVMVINEETEQYIYSTGFLVLRPNESLDKDFLYYFLRTKTFQREKDSYCTGATQKAINNANFSNNLTIPLPPMSVQKEIVEKLDKAAAIREKSKALLAHYDVLAESLFIELFGDPISNEKGWEKKKLGEVVTNLNNMRVPLKSSDRQMLVNKYPYYGASGIIDYVDDFIYEGDNLLIGEDGANLLSRSTPIAFIAKGKYWVNNHAHVNGYNGKANLLYLCFFINMIDLSPYVTGSAQPKLNRGNLDNIEIPLPPLSLQVKFAEMVENIEEQKARAKAEIEQGEAVFQALLQESFV